MSVIKKITRYNGSSWDEPYDIGANAENISIALNGSVDNVQNVLAPIANLNLGSSNIGARQVFIGPDSSDSGATGNASFRTLNVEDIPNLPRTKINNVNSIVASLESPTAYNALSGSFDNRLNAYIIGTKGILPIEKGGTGSTACTKIYDYSDTTYPAGSTLPASTRMIAGDVMEYTMTDSYTVQGLTTKSATASTKGLVVDRLVLYKWGRMVQVLFSWHFLRHKVTIGADKEFWPYFSNAYDTGNGPLNIYNIRICKLPSTLAPVMDIMGTSDGDDQDPNFIFYHRLQTNGDLKLTAVIRGSNKVARPYPYEDNQTSNQGRNRCSFTYFTKS